MDKSKLPISWDACAKMRGVDPVTSLPDVTNCPDRLKAFAVGMVKRAIVVEALNQAAGEENEARWKPDYENGNWDKFYAWVRPGKDESVPSGFGVSHSTYDVSHSGTNVGSRLELRNRKLVMHMLDTPEFRQILIDTMVIPPDEE